MKLVTLKTFNTPIEANILKSKLEEEGIHCFIHDENLGSIGSFGMATGGIKIKVSEADLAKALEILNEISE
ncbi:DUF2007 domain-containing protein [Limibacter armeniacum]|uniref:putative signal transducing protein n=1 Tax=Limibacter armeniacum TaxID=466084 RepID=UPI002FE62D1F